MSLRTQKLLAASLKKMLMTRTLNEITIGEIAEDCNLRRQTFYYHYHDIYELVEWIYIYDISKILNLKKTSITNDEGLFQLFQYLLENKAFVINTCKSIERGTLEQYMYRGSYMTIYSSINEQVAGLNVKEEYKVFMVEFYQYALSGVLLKWIGNNMEEDPGEIITKMKVIISCCLNNALIKFHEKSK